MLQTKGGRSELLSAKWPAGSNLNVRHDMADPRPRRNRATRGAGRVETHVRRHSAEYEALMGSTHWRQLKKAAARRSEKRWPRRPPRCEFCHRPGPTWTFELHHRDGWVKLGRETLDDVVLLCWSCHDREEARCRRRQGRVTQIGSSSADACRPMADVSESNAVGNRGQSLGTAAPPIEKAPKSGIAATSLPVSGWRIVRVA
jgi:hypothetical protein